jgi:hypothetical protein
MAQMTRVHFLAGAIMGFFLFTSMFRLALGPTQAHIQRVLEALSLGWGGKVIEA